MTELQIEVIDLKELIEGYDDALFMQSLKLDDYKDDVYYLKKEVALLEAELFAMRGERDAAIARIKALEAAKIAENKQQ